MARSRFGRLVVLSLAFVLATAQSGRSDEAKPTKPAASPLPLGDFLPGDLAQIRKYQPLSHPVSAKGDLTCKIYSLGDLSDDPKFGEWIADTIPRVVQPESWNEYTRGNLSYYAPAGILVVYHTPATHAQVDAFLKNVKKSLPQSKAAMSSNLTKAPSFLPKTPVLVPAKYSPSDPVKESTQNKSTSYPIPAQAKQPKHLFHFIIRYEGDGIIDSTVAGVVKQLYGTEEQSEDPKPSKKKKKKSPAADSGLTSAPMLDQLFHLIVRYEGDGIIDSTVADVLKAMYAGQSSGMPGLNSPMNLPNAPSYGPAPSSVTPNPVPVAPPPRKSSRSSSPTSP